MSSATDRLYWRTRKSTQRRLKRAGFRFVHVPVPHDFEAHLVRIGRAAAGERLSDSQIAELAGLELARLALSSRDRDNRHKSG